MSYLEKISKKFPEFNGSNWLLRIPLAIVFIQMGLSNTTCNEIHGSNLWYIGICSLIIQTIISGIYSYFLLVFIYVEICKIKTPCCCSN